MGPRRARKKNQRLAHLNRPAPRRGHAFLFSNKKGLEGRNRFFSFAAQSESRFDSAGRSLGVNGNPRNPKEIRPPRKP